MKRIIVILLVMVLLAGCTSSDAQMERALILRSKLQGNSVKFDAKILADYGDKTYTFSLACEADVTGNLKFSVIQPESIAGITGTVSKGTGKLTFDERVLAFDTLADELVSPVSGPWVMMQTLRGGYLTSCAMEGEGLRLSIDDSYAEKALHLDVWLDKNDLPFRCDILWNGRRLLSMGITNFTFV